MVKDLVMKGDTGNRETQQGNELNESSSSKQIQESQSKRPDPVQKEKVYKNMGQPSAEESTNNNDKPTMGSMNNTVQEDIIKERKVLRRCGEEDGRGELKRKIICSVETDREKEQKDSCFKKMEHIVVAKAVTGIDTIFESQLCSSKATDLENTREETKAVRVPSSRAQRIQKPKKNKDAVMIQRRPLQEIDSNIVKDNLPLKRKMKVENEWEGEDREETEYKKLKMDLDISLEQQGKLGTSPDGSPQVQ